MFKLARDMKNAGIAFANHPLTVFAVAQIHNNLQRTILIQGK